MPGKPVGTILPQGQKQGNAPVTSVWHPDPRNTAEGAPLMPHGMPAWASAHPQSTMATYSQKVR